MLKREGNWKGHVLRGKVILNEFLKEEIQEKGRR